MGGEHHPHHQGHGGFKRRHRRGHVDPDPRRSGHRGTGALCLAPVHAPWLGLNCGFIRRRDSKAATGSSTTWARRVVTGRAAACHSSRCSVSTRAEAAATVGKPEVDPSETTTTTWVRPSVWPGPVSALVAASIPSGRWVPPGASTEACRGLNRGQVGRDRQRRESPVPSVRTPDRLHPYADAGRAAAGAAGVAAPVTGVRLRPAAPGI